MADKTEWVFGLKPSKLLKTGQITQYNGIEDDGYFEKGIPRSYTSLSTGDYSGTTNITLSGKTIAMENDCVVDNRTGLMWMKNTPDSDIGPGTDGKLFWGHWTLASKTDIAFDSVTKKINSGAGEFSTTALLIGRKFTVAGSTSNDGTYTVAAITATDITTSEVLSDEGAGASITITTTGDLIWNFYDEANTQTLAGHSDWRVPNIFELFSLIVMDAGIGAPYIDTNYFQCISSYYWSSTTYPVNVTYALRVDFIYGYVRSGTKTMTSYYVRLVRGD